MSINKAIKSILSDSTGARVGDRDFLPTKKKELLREDISNALLDQWDAAGRDAARIYLKIDEADGSSIFLTGYDGHNKYVGYDSTGFGYIEPSRIKNATVDEKWDDQLTLGHIKKNLDEMDRTQVADLVSRLKKCLTKRSKGRRQSEVKNFVKRFQAACAADKAKEKDEVKVKTEAKGEDVSSDRIGSKKKPDKKGEYSWHTKGNRMSPMKEAMGRFRHYSNIVEEENKDADTEAKSVTEPNSPKEKALTQKALTRGDLAVQSKFASSQCPKRQ